MYAGKPEATMVPPEWFGWLHGTQDRPLPKEGARSYQWVRLHQPNLTGTAGAYLPKGHIFSVFAKGRTLDSAGTDSFWRPSE
jgi:NADH:ubiquinone oxidoreductase subunit